MAGAGALVQERIGDRGIPAAASDVLAPLRFCGVNLGAQA